LSYQQLRPTDKLLLGPGPASVDPEILRAASLGVLGYLDPEFIGIMDGTMDLLRKTFRTSNDLTIVVPGTGMAGMEAAVFNTVEPGDKDRHRRDGLLRRAHRDHGGAGRRHCYGGAVSVGWRR